MLSDLFKPAWKSSSVVKRLKAIADMDDENPEQQQVLTQLAANDPDTTVCTAAIQKMTSIANLMQLSNKTADSLLIQEVENRVKGLIRGARNEGECIALLRQFPELSLHMAAHAEFASVRTTALQNMSTGQLLEVLASTTFTDSRQIVSEKLENIEDLESARKMVRGKDKNAERQIKAKIDEYRKQQRLKAENFAQVEKLILEVEYLVSHDWIPEFKAKFLAHKKHWDNLDFEVEPASKQCYQRSRNIIDKRFEEQKLIEETQNSQQQLVDELTTFVKEVARIDIEQSILSVEQTRNRLNQYTLSWKQLADKSRPNLVIHDQFENMLRALDSAIRLVQQSTEIIKDDDTADLEKKVQGRDANQHSEKIQKLSVAIKNLKWPVAYGKLQVAVDLQAQLDKWHTEQKTARLQRQQKLDSLHKKISSIFRFTRSGNLARAKQYSDRVEKGLDLFQGKDRAGLEERLSQAHKALDKMGDWKNFATEPKYLELCEAMEQLATSKQHPDKLSSDMKALQKQWSLLGHSEISDEYWPRFKEAADKVYKPCAEFFDKRHKTRQQNLEQRQQYVENIRELLENTDWDDNPDFKGAQSTLRSISDKFLKVKEVEHKAGQKQWKKFCKLKDAVYARLDVAYEANIELKNQLIKQAEQLAAAEPEDDNLVKLKVLQTRWKNIGITKRNQDQKAWKEFKKQGDIIYQKLQQLRQGKRNETDRQLNAYRGVISQIKKLASTAKNLSEADQMFMTLQTDYANLPELPSTLPEKLVEGIQRDYVKACNLLDQCHSRLVKKGHDQQLEALREKANLCAILEAQEATPSEKMQQELTEQWDSIELSDTTLLRRIEARRSAALKATDRETIEAERRMLCIQLEIALDIESPEADKALRMQYQLDQMNELGLGQQKMNTQQQLESIELEWLCMPGANPSQQAALDKRFQRALRTAGTR